jgi:hypothetical protein
MVYAQAGKQDVVGKQQEEGSSDDRAPNSLYLGVEGGNRRQLGVLVYVIVVVVVESCRTSKLRREASKSELSYTCVSTLWFPRVLMQMRFDTPKQ